MASFHLIGALRSVEDKAKSLLPDQTISIIVSLRLIIHFQLDIDIWKVMFFLPEAWAKAVNH